jgi:hypothetical protein
MIFMDNALSASDVALLNGNNNAFGDNGFMWIFALLILFWGGNGWGGNNRNGDAVTEATLCNSMNFNDLQNAVGRISDTQQTQFTQLNNGLCQIGYQNLQNVANLQQQMSECCCTTQRGIDNVNYNIAQTAAAINANTTEQTQKILDAICSNRMADMQNQINNLQLQANLAGVVRYPNATTFTAGVNPFFNSSCGCSC